MPRSAASRIADSAIVTGATTRELRVTGGSGGNWVSAGPLPPPLGASQSIAFRLTKKETAITAIAIRIVVRLRSSFR